MIVWKKSKTYGVYDMVYWLTKEFSPDWWGKLQLVDGKWKFSCGIRGQDVAYTTRKTYKSLDTAKFKAKIALGLAQADYAEKQSEKENKNEN